jgi:hypothetical protein
MIRLQGTEEKEHSMILIKTRLCFVRGATIRSMMVKKARRE